MGLNIFTSRGYLTIGMEKPVFFDGVTVIIFFILFFILVRFRHELLELIKKLPKKATVGALLIFSVCIQLLSVYYLRVNPSWDFGAIVRGSQQLLENSPLEHYFVLYPNNIFITCILAVVGKVTSPELFNYQIFNIFIITLSQYLIFRITSKMVGESAGVVSLAFAVLFFPYIFYAPIVYTDTVSLLFLLLPINLLLNKDGGFRSNITLILLASIIFALGMVLKGSLIIFVIAFSIVLLLFMPGWKRIYFILPFIVLFLVKTSFNFVIYDNGIVDKQQVARDSYPITHWIVMAQNREKFGRYSGVDFDWTGKLLELYPREKVKEYHMQEWKERVQEKGFMGNLRFNVEKLNQTWTDATYYSLNKLQREPVEPEHFTRLVDSNSGDLVQGFARIQHLLLLGGLLFLFKLKSRNEFITFAMLSIIGFFLFFLIWETRSRYLVSLTPLLIMLSTIGYFGIDTKLKSLKRIPNIRR